MKSLLDKDFVYIRAIDTDIRKTFERIRKAAPQESSAVRESVKTSKVMEDCPARISTPAVSAPVTQIRRKTCSSR